MFRKALTIGVVSACLVAPVLAQRPKAAAGQKQRQQQQQPKRQLQAKKLQRPDAGIRKFQRGLNLNDAQTEQLRALLSTREMERERLRTAGAKGRKADARAVQEQFRSSLRGILTPSQIEIFEQRGIGKKK